MNSLKELFTELKDVNVLVRKINDCPMKKSDNQNGYYLVADTWGTCFIRIRQKSEIGTIKVFQREKIKCSYTAFPAKYAHNLYHVFVNTNKSIRINLSEGSFIIGGHVPTRLEEDANFRNHTFLIYSPKGEPIITESGIEDAYTVVVEKGDAVFLFDIERICKVGFIKYLNFSEDGFLLQRS